MNIYENNNSLFNLALIIPFFNEEKRIDSKVFVHFANQNPAILLILVNDGSTDKTDERLEEILSQQPLNIRIHRLSKNRGKGNAIREAFLTIKDNTIPFIGYIDSDLSTSLESFLMIYNKTKEKNIDVVYGSRIKKIDTEIKRTLFRHITGRIIATIIDTRFNIGCYDTQCGAKLFKMHAISLTTAVPFHTRWLFDVEILLRLRKTERPFTIAEIALDKWEHKKGSKISGLSIFLILREFFVLFTKYE